MLFDERNPSLIICSEKLEAALDQKALHVTQFRWDILLNHIHYSLKKKHLIIPQNCVKHFTDNC